MPQATGMAAVATSGGRIYLLGGVGTESQVNIYDPATGSWASGAALPFGRRGAAAVADPAGRIYLLGGALDPALGGGRMARVDLYDPATNSWASTPPAAMSVPRHSLGAAWLNGRIVTAGGDDGLTTNFIGSRAVESYDPATNTWEPLPSLLALRAGMGLAAAGGKLYAVGGYSQNTSPVAVFPPSYPAPVEVYDPATGGWTVGPSLQIPRSYAGVALSEWNGGIYIVGGFNGVQPRQTEMLFPAP